MSSRGDGARRPLSRAQVRRRAYESVARVPASLTAMAARVATSALRVHELELRVAELERAASLREDWKTGAARWSGEELPAEANVPRLHLHLLGPSADARLGSARPERALRSLELLAVLAMHSEGLTAEQLALALYGERGKTVTVRVQVHRLRTHLGHRALQTQPYRLTDSYDADSLEVARLIATGHPEKALRAYLGPLLPASDAPAIVEARGLLEESLRRSILTAADPELLARWLVHPSGADDLLAARTLVAVLPAGDPRRGAATASAAAVGQRMSLAGPGPG
jgi:hypothetical protein